jgi:hypothetical protein
MISDPSGKAETADQRKPPKRRPIVIRIFRNLKRYENRRRRRAKQEKSDRDLIMARWTRRVGIFTAALVVVGIVTGVIFWRQLDEMQAEQRPWVYAVDVVPGGRIILANEWYAVPLKFSIKNTGHLPAFFVVPKTSAAVITIGSSAFTIHNYVCDEYRHNPIMQSSGNTIFADQTISHGGFTSEDYPKVRKYIWDALGGDKMIVVFGCIDYQFPAQPGHHQSRFSFAVGKLVDQGILERIAHLPDDPTTVDIRLLPVNIGDEKPPAD